MPPFDNNRKGASTFIWRGETESLPRFRSLTSLFFAVQSILNKIVDLTHAHMFDFISQLFLRFLCFVIRSRMIRIDPF